MGILDCLSKIEAPDNHIIASIGMSDKEKSKEEKIKKEKGTEACHKDKW